jgi:hypothetical protein
VNWNKVNSILEKSAVLNNSAARQVCNGEHRRPHARPNITEFQFKSLIEEVDSALGMHQNKNTFYE